MFRTLALAAVAALPLTGAVLVPAPALAQGCLSAKETRSAVQNGQAESLSKMVKRIQKATGGEILPTPELCNDGGRLVYRVKVLRPDGSVETLAVDAASGNIAGY
ncbi:MAG: hypothetical protein J0H08_02240 [Rhizobiales bacterium]|jgi:uncharacterized membrane protein YkoI|nr:hypothetical protein [Hyphomicrobiales bacterium]